MTPSTKLHRYEGRARNRHVRREAPHPRSRNACADCQPCSTRSAKPWIIRTAPTPLPWPRSSDRCPSGALHVARADGVAEPGPAQNTATLTADGPTCYARRARAHGAGRQRHAHATPEWRCAGAGRRRTSPCVTAATARAASGTTARCRQAKRPAAPVAGGRLAIRASSNGPLIADRRVDAHGDERARLARGNDVPLPLRRLRQQALLRRHSQEDRVHRLDSACAATPRKNRMERRDRSASRWTKATASPLLRQRFALPEA